MDSRAAPLKSLFGDEETKRIKSARVLVVGAGGIGCELLKDLVVAEVGEIHLVDLDTIDLSNLNRQFLFSMSHIKQSKAEVAAEVAKTFNPNVHIVPYQADITTPEFGAKWFRTFELVFNALDNASARRYVNKMCVSTGTPLIDAGSAGFNGQTQVIIPGKTECYDCLSHPAPKSFPVCTIRSTPTQPVHCIVWAKSYLFQELFGVPETIADDAEGDADELQDLKREQHELSELRSSLDDSSFVPKLVSKVFGTDIRRLAAMTKVWEDRTPPKPLELPENLDVTLTQPGEDISQDDQRVWSVLENLQVLVYATKVLAERRKQGDTLLFDKDDDDALDFVTAAANLRAHVFGIPLQTEWNVKSIAGNIIPAVATTNAIVSGLAAIEGLKLLSRIGQDALRSVNIWRTENSVLMGEKPAPPRPGCVVCGVARTTVSGDTAVITLEDVVEKILKLDLGYDDVSIVSDKLIYDPDYDDNLKSTLKELGLSENFITVIDEDDKRINLELYIADQPTASVSVEEVEIPLREQKSSLKRGREDSEEEGQPTKKQEFDDSTAPETDMVPTDETTEPSAIEIANPDEAMIVDNMVIIDD